MTHPSPKRNMVPKAVLMRSGLVSLTTTRPVNTAQPRTTVNSARPMTNVFNKAHSTVRRPINKNTSFKNSNFNKRVNIVKDKNVNAVRPKVVVNDVRPKAVLNVVKGNQVNAVKASAYWIVAGKDYILLPLWTADLPFSQSSKSSPDVGFKPSGDNEKKVTEEQGKESGDSSKDGESYDQEKEDNVNSTNTLNVASTNKVNAVGAKTSIELPDDPNMPELDDIVYSDDDEDVGAEASMNNLDAFMPMDVKSAFLYGKIEEDVYVCQPPGFEDPDFPNRVYKVYKALYGLHQSLKAWMSALVFINPESSTQADRAQSSRVPVPLPEDPYEAIRQAYLDGTDTESEPFKDPIDTETPELPLTVAPPISLAESSPPVLVPILRRTARMVVRGPPAMSSGLSACIAEVAAMSESAFLEDSEEDEEIEESLDFDNVGEDAEDEGPTAEDEDPAAGDEGLAAGVEGPDTDDKSYGLDDEIHGMDDEGRGLDDEGHSVESDGLGLEEDEVVFVPEGQQQAAPVVGTVVSAPLGLGYRALRRQELALEEDQVYSTFEVRLGSGSTPESERPERMSVSRQPTLTTWTDPEDGMVYIDIPTYPPPAPPVQTPPSPEWMSGSLSISPSPSVVPSLVSSLMVPLTAPSPIASPATAKTAYTHY
ncbi:reverse transcriptase domain-containing protein [Tanacetum coccineum]